MGSPGFSAAFIGDIIFSPTYIFDILSKISWVRAGKVAQWFRALASLPGNPGSICNSQPDTLFWCHFLVRCTYIQEEHHSYKRKKKKTITLEKNLTIESTVFRDHKYQMAIAMKLHFWFLNDVTLVHVAVSLVKFLSRWD